MAPAAYVSEDGPVSGRKALGLVETCCPSKGGCWRDEAGVGGLVREYPLRSKGEGEGDEECWEEGPIGGAMFGM